MSGNIELGQLTLRPASPKLAEELAEYYRRNSDFLRAFEPERTTEFFTAEHQRGLLTDEAEKAVKKEAFRFYISQTESPERIIGSIGLNNIVWGCFYSCFLGYKLDKDELNRGYMTKAVNKVVEFAFSELGLHRVEANVMPRNGASLRVLQKCGFTEEGYAKKYLKINGVWEDHIHMVRLNDAL